MYGAEPYTREPPRAAPDLGLVILNILLALLCAAGVLAVGVHRSFGWVLYLLVFPFELVAIGIGLGTLSTSRPTRTASDVTNAVLVRVNLVMVALLGLCSR
jgi:hypothetical protein